MFASLVVIAGGMTGIGFWVGVQIENGVIHQTASYTALYVSSVVEPNLQKLVSANSLNSERHNDLDLIFKGEIGQRITDLRIWDTNHHVVYSTTEGEIGMRYDGGESLGKALRGWVASRMTTITEHGTRRLEIYGPIRQAGTSDIVAAVQLFQAVDSLDESIATSRRNSWLIVAAATVLMYLLLAGFVKRASDTIRRQQNELRSQVQRLYALLEQNEALNERVKESSRRTSAINERFLRRIGAELHDGPAQDLGLALLRLEHLAPESQRRGADSEPDTVRDIGEPKTSTDFELIQGSLQHALQEIRAISSGMSLPELEGLSTSETVFRAARAHERRTGTQVAVSSESVPEGIALPVKMAIYRVVQEALSNAFRHAGGVGQNVFLRFTNGVLELRVADSGAGLGNSDSSDNDDHLGIVGMRERVESLGGTFRIETAAGTGTVVVAYLPVELNRQGPFPSLP